MKPYVKMFLIALCVNILIQTSIADNEGGKNPGEDNKDSAADGKSQNKGVEQENQAGKNPGGETKAADGNSQNKGVEQEKNGEAAAQSPDNPAGENGKGNELPKNPEGEGASGSPQDNQGGDTGNEQQPPKKPEGKDDSGIPRNEQGEGTDNGNKPKEPKGDEANGDEKTNQGKKPPKKTKEDGEDQESEDDNEAGENSGAGESLYEPEPVNPEDIVPFDSISTERPEVQKEIVDCHNEIRKNVNPPATKMSKLVWSKELQKGAQEWADTCFFNHSTEENRTRPDTMLGENILTVSVPVTWKACTEVWLAEKNYFEYGNEGINIYTCGHFTQMVADVTQQIGCAVSNCTVDGGFCNFYVCRYNPIGNEAGHYSRPYDAGKSCSRCHNCEQNSTLCLDPCTVRDSYRNCPTYPKDRICPRKDLNDKCSVTCRCKPPPPAS